MRFYTVLVAIPHPLEDDTCRIVRVMAENIAKVLEYVESTLEGSEYIVNITVRLSEDELALEVWHYLEGRNGYTSYN